MLVKLTQFVVVLFVLVVCMALSGVQRAASAAFVAHEMSGAIPVVEPLSGIRPVEVVTQVDQPDDGFIGRREPPAWVMALSGIEWHEPMPSLLAPLPEKLASTPRPLTRLPEGTIEVVRGCPAGMGPWVSSDQMAQWSAPYDWGGITPAQMGQLFTKESGGCVGAVSPTGDSGCTQMHWDMGTAKLFDFDRIRTDCPYAIESASVLFWKREAMGLRGITAWTAGRGWLY